jgi:hypothetical protein
MEAGKAPAQHRRNRGLATGGKARLHARALPLAGWEFDRVNAKCRWEGRRADIVEDYRRAVFPERYDWTF